MIKDLILDIFFPKYCAGCGKEGRYICRDCQVFVSENPPVVFDSQQYGLNGLIAGWDYDGVIKQLIHQIKYQGEGEIIKELVRDFIKISNLNFLNMSDMIITFVPMHKKREKQRGFNQAELIAKEIGKTLNLPVMPLLKKVKETQDQTALTKEERAENVKGSFVMSLAHELSSCKSCLLVDDVFTSGSTMKECAGVLRKAGYKQVWGLVLARTV